MSYSDSDSGNAWRNDGGVRPHAYDPYLHPELFRGVATRRVFAFLIDMVVISVPVILGYLFIALFGVVDDSSVVMLDFLERAFKHRTPTSIAEIRELVMDAGLKRVRPLLMSTATTVFGLLPVFLIQGRGSDVMQPMAVPSVGGMAVQVITLFIAPCLYCLVKEWQFKHQPTRQSPIPANGGGAHLVV